MLAAGFFISPQDLWSSIGGAKAPQLIDVCRREVYEASPGVLPTAVWQGPVPASQWSAGIDRSRPVVVTCKAGHNLSQGAAAELRAELDAIADASGYPRVT